jgi:hypothetical protein
MRSILSCTRSAGLATGGFATESGVGFATIRRIENADKNARGHASTFARIQTAFEAAGVLFIDDDGSAGIGVRLVRTKKKKMRR